MATYQVIDGSAPLAQTEKGTAMIKTRTIEVQVVKIDNRQMTQSVFRQLPEKNCVFITHDSLWKSFSEDNSFFPNSFFPNLHSNANIWGKVRYSFDGYNCSGNNGIHILFEEDGILYRYFISETIQFRRNGELFYPKTFFGSEERFSKYFNQINHARKLFESISDNYAEQFKREYECLLREQEYSYFNKKVKDAPQLFIAT